MFLEIMATAHLLKLILHLLLMFFGENLPGEIMMMMVIWILFAADTMTLVAVILLFTEMKSVQQTQSRKRQQTYLLILHKIVCFLAGIPQLILKLPLQD